MRYAICMSPRPTRRDFLLTAASTAAMSALPRSVRAAVDGDIDAHVHVWTPDVAKYPLAEGFEVSQMKPASFTPEELFAHTQPNGVGRIVLIQMSYYRYDNRYMLDTMARFPGVFSGVAIVDEAASDPGAAMRDLAAKGVRGFRINPGRTAVDAWIGSAGMAEMWGTAADEGLAICPLIGPEALPAIGKMCERFPKTRVVIDHFARIGADGVIRGEQLDALARLADHAHVHVKTSAFYALGKKQPPYTDLGPMIRRMRDAYGAERLMWASDCPYQVGPGQSYGDAIRLVREGLDFLSAPERSAILHDTAERVFFS
ncbi:MAG: amidohydrolase [Verrucomicrobiales bacterium]|nr:amidohydrolase [Verrucomicrobiales bacterium]